MKLKSWNLILPILSGAIGVVIGGLVDWKKEDTLAAKEFEYRIIESSLSRDINTAKRNLDFLLDLGLINTIDTLALRERMENENLPAIGYWDGFTIANLNSLLANIYKNTGRFPKDLSEFRRTVPIELHLKILGITNIRYSGVGNNLKECKLEFAGPNNRFGDDDDKIYSTNNILSR